jgi:hypothetical protein
MHAIPPDLLLYGDYTKLLPNKFFVIDLLFGLFDP